MRTALIVLLISALATPRPGRAQGRVAPPPVPAAGAVTGAPGPRYDIGALPRLLAGSNWRALWQLPITFPILRIDTFAGGLVPEREGGNKQSTTLHFVDASGQGWVFRSIDKYPDEKLSPEVNGTLLGELIRDQISALHPLGGLMVPPLLQALGILHVEPALYVLPDEPALGEFRARFAGMLGTLELKPNEGPDDTPGFAGSRKIHDSEDLFDRIEESAAHAVDERELLRARLVDFIIGDTDRSTDQYRFARFPHPDGGARYLWRPLPRDRDWAFLRATGPLSALARATAFPKFVPFDREHSSILAHTFTGHVVDRRLLVSLDRVAFDEEVARVQTALTDPVIEAAVGRLPPSYPQAHRQLLADALRARRDGLADIADRFYDWLASDVDVHATDEADRAEIVRHPDGIVDVTLFATRRAAETSNGGQHQHARETAYYQRSFLPRETGEVRVYLHGGDDVAVVRGSGSGIVIRVIGGGGDDLLADSSAAGGVHLYDHRGENRFMRSPHTVVDTRAWQALSPPEGLRVDMAWAPEWGDRDTWHIAPDYTDAAGIVVGAGRTWSEFGFRRLPHHWQVAATALYGTEAREPGVEVEADYRFENSRRWLEARIRWSGFDGFRWYGPGNQTGELDSELSLVHMRRFSLEPSYHVAIGPARSPADSAARSPTDTLRALTPLRGEVSVGPVLRHTRTDAPPEGRFSAQRPIGFEPLWQLGAAARLAVGRTDGRAAPRRGALLHARVAGYPALLDAPGASARAQAELSAFVPLVGDGLHLALRAGGRSATGDYPAFDAAMIGGRTTLRGFPFQRLAGDAAAYGGAELRAPLGNMELLLKGEIGVFALVDAGRVWRDSDSPGGWHTGMGGGLWFETLGRAANFAIASGERVRYYLSLAQPF